MTGTPIPRLVLTLAAPTVVSMLVSSIYNMADTFFVSQLGTSASGAVGVVFSLMAIIQAVGFTLGMGSGSIISPACWAASRRRTPPAMPPPPFSPASASAACLRWAGCYFCPP